MEKTLTSAALVVVAVVVGGCGGTGSSSTGSTTPLLSSGDIALHRRSVEFEQAYEARWHVSKETADCVMAYTNGNRSEKAITKALKAHPRHVFGSVDCTH